MPYVVVENFNEGLDRRRAQVAGAPGTLWDCFNAHITRGGEIEKRKAFVPTYALSAGQTFGMLQAANQLYVFGSIAAGALTTPIPTGVNYVRCQHPNGTTPMTGVVFYQVFAGLPYCIAAFADGSVHQYYNGAIVTDWEGGAITGSLIDNAGIATYFANLISANPNYTASASGAVVTISAATAGVPFSIMSSVVPVAGGVGDETFTVVQTVANVTGVVEVLATGSFAVTGGTADPTVNTISDVNINGVDALGSPVDWVTSNTVTAAAIATQINGHASVPEYSATAVGNVVTLKAAPGSGKGPVGLVVAPTVTGNFTVGSVQNMSGGVDAVAAVAQQCTATVGGTFEVGDTFVLVIDGNNFGSPQASVLLTLKQKLYATSTSTLYFSGLNTATGWAIANIGAGFQDMSTQDGNANTLTALSSFLGNMVIMSQNTSQIWNIDPNPASNALLQTLANTGTRAPRSVVPFGNNDLFYLDGPGIRSLRAFFATSLAMITDIGTPVDTLVQAAINGITAQQANAAVGVIDPIDRRYWIAIGDSIFVFSYFSSAKINAWSRYDVGFQITDFAIVGTRIYARAGDKIYLYGGASGNAYDTGPSDAYPATVTLPYLTAGKPATDKKIIGWDVAVTGTWEMNLLTDPANPAVILPMGSTSKTTYLDKLPGGNVVTTHFAPQMICNTPGPATIANMVISYEDGDSPDPLQK